MFSLTTKRLVVNSNSQLNVTKADGTPIAIGSDAAAFNGFISQLGLSSGGLLKYDAGSLITVDHAPSILAVSAYFINPHPEGVYNLKLILTHPSGGDVDTQGGSLYKRIVIFGSEAPIELAERITKYSEGLATCKLLDAPTNLYEFKTLSDGWDISVHIDKSESSPDLATPFSEDKTKRLLPSSSVNDYRYLSNLIWSWGEISNSYDFDRRSQVLPIKGDTYTTYNFSATSTVASSVGDSRSAGEPVGDSTKRRVRFSLIVNDNLTTLKSDIVKAFS